STSLNSISCPTSAYCAGSDTVGNVVTSSDPTELTASPASLPPATIGINYQTTLAATGGIGTASFSSTSLPAGLSISASGTISGTPQVSGIDGFTVLITDSAGDTADISLTLTVSEQANLAVTTVSLPNGTVGTPYKALLSASGGTGLYTWSVLAGSLPGGLSVTPLTGSTGVVAISTGSIAGTPSAPGTFDVELQVTDSATLPLTADAWLTINIQPSTASQSLIVTTSSVPHVTSGSSYSVSLEASGGTAPYAWTVTSGNLPAGLALAPSGLVSGTPLAPGTEDVSFAVSDMSQPIHTADVSLTFTIDASNPGQGIWEISSAGSLYAYGSAGNISISQGTLDNQSPTGMAAQTGGAGLWITTGEGYVGAYGSANYFGSMGGSTLVAPIVGMAATPDGRGYWLVASDGGIFAFGDATFFGSMGGKPLAAPVVGIAPAADGHGYWLVASDGGIFAFGDAGFFGSMGGKSLASPVDAIASTPDGQGYWLVAPDGGIFAFGDAGFLGSAGSTPLPLNVIAILPDGSTGYWLEESNGALLPFGSSDYFGRAGVPQAAPGQAIPSRITASTAV
ncbi:MAG TPA: putative Ig domain-containing protein, partial [Acidimicrobiales bacterium]|nr:putative Ig domain-containing protein [Acidimicrobiales bacterium]